MGEAFSTNPLDLLNVDDWDWVILMSCAQVLKEDAEAREEERRRERGDIGVV